MAFQSDLQIGHQLRCQFSDGDGIGAIAGRAIADFHGDQSGVQETIQVPVHRTCVKLQRSHQLRWTHGVVCHKPQHLHSRRIGQQAQRVELCILQLFILGAYKVGQRWRYIRAEHEGYAGSVQ